eukprot:CAMPEP_0180433960 /NCGR_PEP_ID=MMETSP1036_2-20121128/9711_1 /TAXON_ID=632150 /ORGANISM="Azadinium spinosum, Strain 3D9" /LENGTH=45 /DNA_ID= /DNA_START= /DNA_END= /DNA_ORIENTATION=
MSEGIEEHDAIDDKSAKSKTPSSPLTSCGAASSKASSVGGVSASV